VEELITFMLGGGAAALAVRPWVSLTAARLRGRSETRATD
jgi:hypothetical protein